MGGGLGDYARYGSIGISWVLSTAVYLYLGYRGGVWLDERLGSQPVMMVLGMLAGAVLSLISLARELLALEKTFRRSGETDQGLQCAPDRERKHFPEMRRMTKWPVPPKREPGRPGSFPLAKPVNKRRPQEQRPPHEKPPQA